MLGLRLYSSMGSEPECAESQPYPKLFRDKLLLQPFHNTPLRGGPYYKRKDWIPIEQRKYDVLFLGLMDKYVYPWIRYHRDVVDKKIMDLKQNNPKLKVFSSGSKLRRDKFMDILCDSKILISPWGYGEWYKI